MSDFRKEAAAYRYGSREARILIETADSIEQLQSQVDGYQYTFLNDQHRIAELQAQLKKYGWHVAGCPAFDATTCDVCDCGFEQALEQKP